MARAVKQGVFRDGNGAVVTTSRNGTVAVFLAGTTTSANIYTASTGGTAVHSVNTDASGRFKFYVDSVDYTVLQLFDIVLSGTGVNAQTYANEMVGAGVALLTPATSTVGNIVLWNDTLGETVSDSGVLIGTLMNVTGSNLAIGSDADGDMYYRASSVLARLAKGTAGSKMFMNAAGTAPEWANGMKSLHFSRNMATGNGDVGYTGFGFKPSSLIVVFGEPTLSGGVGMSDSTKTGFCANSNRGGGTLANLGNWEFVNYIINVNSGDVSGAVESAGVASYDADGFTLTWLVTGSPTGTITFNVLAFR